MANESEEFTENKRVSSANMANFDFGSRSMSLTYIENSCGEKQDLWGTAALISLEDDSLVPVLT